MAWVALIVALQSPGPSWDPVPVDEFLHRYRPAAERLEDFYANCSFDVSSPTFAVVFHVKTLDGQWFSSRKRKGEAELINLIRSDGKFNLLFDSEADAWVPHHASSNLGGFDSVLGDTGFGAFFDTHQRLTYFDLVKSDPGAVRVFRKGSRYRACYVQEQLQKDGSLRTGQRYFELDAGMRWVCVEIGLTWDGGEPSVPGYYRYSHEAPNQMPILERWEVPGYPDQTLVIKDFEAVPADPAVFKLTTYGLSESLLKPKVAARTPRWGWLSNPMTLVIGGALFLLLAYRLRNA